MRTSRSTDAPPDLQDLIWLQTFHVCCKQFQIFQTIICFTWAIEPVNKGVFKPGEEKTVRFEPRKCRYLKNSRRMEVRLIA